MYVGGYVYMCASVCTCVCLYVCILFRKKIFRASTNWRVQFVGLQESSWTSRKIKYFCNKKLRLVIIFWRLSYLGRFASPPFVPTNTINLELSPFFLCLASEIDCGFSSHMWCIPSCISFFDVFWRAVQTLWHCITPTLINHLVIREFMRGPPSSAWMNRQWSEDCFYYCSERNHVVVLFGTLKVQSFILTEVSDCSLLIVVTSSTFLKRKDMLKEKSS